MAITITVLYPEEEGKHFDLDYYLKKHMPLVQEKWSPKGLTAWHVVKLNNTASGDKSPYSVECKLHFGSADEFQKAVEADGPVVMGDIPNFTDTQPILLVGDVKGGWSG